VHVGMDDSQLRPPMCPAVAHLHECVPAVKKTGAVPPGNAKGNKEWSSRQRAAKPEIRLTPGKGIQDLSVPLSDILQQVVDQNRVRPRRHAGCRRPFGC
jgi:hypothetical protein